MATLVYSDVDGVDRSFALGNEPITVGRAPECAIRSEDPRVSRVHARFFVEGGVLWVEDLNSANGIFVGPNRVARAPVPTAEIILIGSLMIRLLPASGTLPPPIGLHGTLATWLGMERKARTAVEDERDAFAKRVGELHQQIAALKVVPDEPTQFGKDVREDAGARAVALETALGSVQDELASMREAHAEAVREAKGERDELDKLKKSSQQELEALRLELAKVREAKNVAETQAGMIVAEKLADADFKIAELQRELAKLSQGKPDDGPDPRIQQLGEAVTTLTSRAEKAEKELATVSIRAQGAERNLSGAAAQAAKAETRAAQLEERAKDAEAKLAEKEAAIAAARERAEELEMTVGGASAPIAEAEARTAKLAAEVAELTSQFETRRDRLVELETGIAKASEAAKAAEAAAAAARAEATASAAKAAEADKRAAEMKARVDALAGADSQIAVATKAKDDAIARATANEQRATAAERRADDAEKRAGAADTMAKAMAKDVAEALRRAAEADSKAKANVRELAETRGKAGELDKVTAEATAARLAAEERAKHAEAELARVQKELGDQLAKAEQELAEHVSTTQRDLAARAEQTQRDLRTKVEEVQREMTAKLEQVGRELAAERSSSLQLVDRKTQLERELGEARKFAPRAEAAETRVVELEVQLETLQERADDLESGLAVAETSRQATVDDERTKTKQLEKKLAAAERTIADSNETIEKLRARLGLLETQMRAADDASRAAEQAVTELRPQLAEAIRAAEEHRGISDAQREQLTDALAQISEAEQRMAGLERSAEAADLAIGRAGALQRQLDEAIAKLTWMERDLSTAKGAKSAENTELAEKLASAEKVARGAEERVRDSSAKLGDVDRQAREYAARVQQLEGEVARQGAESRTIQMQYGELEKKLTDAERRVAANEQRAIAAEQRAIGAEADAASAGVTTEELEEARERIAELERELSKADNVRSFAAETEREIAQLQRELREAKGNVTRLTLERDRMESELRDSRDDSETKSRGVGPSVDVAKFNQLMARASELEKENTALRKQLEALETRLEEAEEKAESTATGTQLPLGGVAEQVSILEESIDSLRSNMRAASDETAMMDQTESVVAVASAVSQAAEHIERARAAIKSLVKTFSN